MTLRFRVLSAVSAAMLLVAGTMAGVAQDAAKPDPLKDFNDETFLEAAYDNCITVDNRSPSSCNCERKLIGDRIEPEDKKMAYLYWRDKDAFVTRFEAKKKEDPEFPKAFSDRFSNIQALIIAACGT